MRRHVSCLGSVMLTASLAACGSGGPAPGTTAVRPADGMVMVFVPGGEFDMGSDDGACDNEQPAHTVALDGFWIDRTEVTNAQFALCVAAGACDPPADHRSRTRPSYYGDSAYDGYPVLCVTWYHAAAYCEWAGARLPTEAEWEYAARGPAERRYPWGEEFDGDLLNHASYQEGGTYFGYAGLQPDTSPVGAFPEGASWCGALDMAGNVWEWVADWYAEYPAERQENPVGPFSGDLNVARGGSFIDGQLHTRTAVRFALAPDFIDDFAGFRCARR